MHVFKFLWLSILFLTGCGFQKSTKPLVITSIPPYVEMVQAIAEDLVDVKSFLASEDNPHLFEPTAAQMRALEQASLFIGVGEPFEKRIAAYLKNSPTRILDLSAQDRSADRHIWMSPHLAQTQVRLIKEALLKLVPENQAHHLDTNSERYIKKLQTLSQAIKEQLEPFKGEAILVSHASFGYFCNDYALLQVAVEKEGKDPSLAEIQEILHNPVTFRCALIVPHSQAKGTRLIAQKIDIPIYNYNPLSEDYLNNMHKLAGLIAQ